MRGRLRKMLEKTDSSQSPKSTENKGLRASREFDINVQFCYKHSVTVCYSGFHKGLMEEKDAEGISDRAGLQR